MPVRRFRKRLYNMPCCGGGGCMHAAHPRPGNAKGAWGRSALCGYAHAFRRSIIHASAIARLSAGRAKLRRAAVGCSASAPPCTSLPFAWAGRSALRGSPLHRRSGNLRPAFLPLLALGLIIPQAFGRTGFIRLQRAHIRLPLLGLLLLLCLLLLIVRVDHCKDDRDDDDKFHLRSLLPACRRALNGSQRAYSFFSACAPPAMESRILVSEITFCML